MKRKLLVIAKINKFWAKNTRVKVIGASGLWNVVDHHALTKTILLFRPVDGTSRIVMIDQILPDWVEVFLH